MPRGSKVVKSARGEIKGRFADVVTATLLL